MRHFIPGRSSDGEYDEIAVDADDLRTARNIAAEATAGTGFIMDPLPTDCPVRLAFRDLRLKVRGVQGAMALWESYDELCRDPDPLRGWFDERERNAKALADALAAMLKDGVALLALVAATLPAREQLALSVAVEAAGVMRAAE